MAGKAQHPLSQCVLSFGWMVRENRGLTPVREFFLVRKSGTGPTGSTGRGNRNYLEQFDMNT